VSEQTEFIKKLPDNKPVRIFLPIKDSEESLRLNCVLQKAKEPHFNLVFLKSTLPLARFDQNTPIIITLDISGQMVSVEAKTIEIINDQTLKMVPQKTISHEQMREYFRVDCTLPIQLKSIVPEEFDSPDDTWKISGTTVDLSGSGLRASLTSPPPENTQVRMDLALPTAVPSIVNILASPVRISKLTEKLWDAAYHFDDVTDEDRDTIIGCCLVAQRRLLRLKVKVKDI
jgi:c-di-GMP-binding flagellar brake protein YcgR